MIGQPRFVHAVILSRTLLTFLKPLLLPVQQALFALKLLDVR